MLVQQGEVDMKEGKCMICKAVTFIVAVGALNWGLVSFFQYDLVANTLGVLTTPTRVVYGIIGVAGAMKLVSLFIPCPCCSGESCKK